MALLLKVTVFWELVQYRLTLASTFEGILKPLDYKNLTASEVAPHCTLRNSFKTISRNKSPRITTDCERMHHVVV